MEKCLSYASCIDKLQSPTMSQKPIAKMMFSHLFKCTEQWHEIVWLSKKKKKKDCVIQYHHRRNKFLAPSICKLGKPCLK